MRSKKIKDENAIIKSFLLHHYLRNMYASMDMKVSRSSRSDVFYVSLQSRFADFRVVSELGYTFIFVAIVDFETLIHLLSLNVIMQTLNNENYHRLYLLRWWWDSSDDEDDETTSQPIQSTRQLYSRVWWRSSGAASGTSIIICIWLWEMRKEGERRNVK